MANTNVGVALVLSARNQASAVLDEFFNRTSNQLKGLGDGAVKIGEGMAEVLAAKKGLELLKQTTDAFGDQEAAGNHLKAALMGKGGIYDPAVYERLFQYSKGLSSHMTGSTAAYLDMIRVMKQNRIEPEDVLGGIGESAAMLSHYFDNMIPASTAEFAAHMKNDMGVAANQMYEVMDLTARIHDAGVGKTGQEAVMEMNQFFSKVGLGLANLHTQGIEAAKQMGALGTIFMARGISGQSVGTNFRRILDGIMSGEHVKKANEVAKYFKISLDFFDKKGKFLGIDNFVAQIGKLQGLNPAAIEAILKPFSGKQGLSTDFMQFLANEGVGAYGEMKRKIENQGTLKQKVGVIMQGQRQQEAVLESNVTNTKASFGQAIQAPYKELLKILNQVTVSIGAFLERHQKLAKVAGTFIAIASAAAAMIGIVKIIQGIIMVMRVLNLTMAMNPFILIAAAAVAAAVLIYTYWDEIKAFFVKLWSNIKQIFTRAWDWYKSSFLIYFNPVALIFKYWKQVSTFFKGLWDMVKVVFNAAWEGLKWTLQHMTPVGLIYTYWRPIVGFFSKLWEEVKKPFMTIFNWVWDFGSRFLNAGKHIVDSIIEGIMNKIGKVGEVMHEVATKIRAYLPFSPAKEGPLRDIHRLKLVETIAAGIKADAVVKKMQMVTGAMRNAWEAGSNGLGVDLGVNGLFGGNTGSSFAATNNGRTAPVQFNLTVNLYGKATADDAKMLTSTMQNDFERMMRNYMANRERVGFR